MSRGYHSLKIDGADLRVMLQNATTVEEFQRIQALHLRVNESMLVPEIARITGLAESTIHNLHSRCRREGLQCLQHRAKGGRYRSYLSVEEEKNLLAGMEDEAKRGSILEVSKVHAKLEEKCGHKIAKQTTYRMLDRHGWRKIAPRPRHPKADAKIQDDFKKNGRKL